MEQVLHWALHAGEDALRLAPFLFLTLLALEYLEHYAANKLAYALQKAGRMGPGAGALIGCIPQCGFSVAAAHLYNAGLITAGTVAAVFLSTSDEALPILLAGGAGGTVWKLLLAKVIIALMGGFLLDLVWKKGRKIHRLTEDDHNDHCHWNGSRWGLVWEAVKRTAGILLFLFLATFILNGAIGLLGEERLGAFLLSNTMLQPLVAALCGFIPNCAASVLLTEFYLSGAISFGSAAAGLCTAAGVGILELLRGRSRSRLIPILAVYGAAAVAGVLLQWLV